MFRTAVSSYLVDVTETAVGSGSRCNTVNAGHHADREDKVVRLHLGCVVRLTARWQLVRMVADFRLGDAVCSAAA